MDKLQQQLLKIRKLLDITFFKVLFFLLLGSVLYFAMYSNIKPEKLELGLFSVAEKTVRSPVTVEDKKSTEKKRQDAMDLEEDVYILKKEYTQNQVDLITSIFDSAAEVNDEIKEEMKKATESAATSTEEIVEPSLQEKAGRLKAKLTETVVKDLSEEVFTSLVQAPKDEISIAKDLTVTAINNEMSKEISSDEVENSKKRVEEELKYTTLNPGLKTAAIALGRFAVIQNVFYDPEATEDKRHQAAERVEPVKILGGQIIVEEGELISREIHRQLKLSGLLDSQNSARPFIGLAILVSIIISAIYCYFHEQKTALEKKQAHMLLFGLVFLMVVLIMKIVSLFQVFDYPGIGFLFPAALGGILIKILIEEKLAFLLVVIQSICGTIIFNEGITGSLNVSAGISILSGGLAAMYLMSLQNQRSKILQAGLFSSMVNLAVIIALLFLRNGHYSGLEYGLYILFALASGVVSAVLAMGLLPFFEASFGILSTMKLIELSNPNHPLLRKILTEAPGTYHHSVMVANLAESACEAIGANGFLARVGCYYHDVGKTRRPLFFIENQINRDNPHDRLTPDKSTQIIIAHATDGAKILKKYRMPKEIIDIAEQHHGTSLLKFFFHKASQGENEINESDFRYPGPKAQTKESAIIGIADSVEAAVRSMSQPTPEQIENLVDSIISERLQDGQLNECELTLKELQIVADTLCETLKGIFHSRIEYPDMTKQKVMKQA